MASHLVDFHCHLDLYPPDADAFGRAGGSRAYVLSVTTTPSAYRGTSMRSAVGGRVRTALGLHPQLAHQREREITIFEELVGGARYVGEIGLDGGTEFREHMEVQERVFRRALRACATAGGRVLSLHSRGAGSAVLDILGEHPSAGVGVLHWFSGTAAEARRAIDMGCWFSVGPAMLATRKGRELAAIMPPSRVLTETDGPFAKSGKVPLQPAEVGEAISVLADMWRVTPEEASLQVSANLRSLVAGHVG